MAGSSRVRQYAHPGNNLALAFSTDDNDPEGRILNRVIVNKKKKTYLRIYSLRDVNEFVASLNKEGYKQDNDTLEGELINLDWAPCDACGCDVLIGPYFDGGWDCVRIKNNKEGIIGCNGDPMNYSNGEIYCGCESRSDDDDEE
jgi:hypothetical protein